MVRNKTWQGVLVVIVLLTAVFLVSKSMGWIKTPDNTGLSIGGSGSGDGTVVLDTRQGVSSAVTLDAKDIAGSDIVEAFPYLFVENSQGARLYGCASDGDVAITTSKGETLTIWVGGENNTGVNGDDNMFYLRNPITHKVGSEVETFSFNVYNTSDRNNSVNIKVYDDTGTQLTAVANTTDHNTSSYYTPIGNSEIMVLTMKYQNQDASTVEPLGAVCVAMNEPDLFEEVELITSGWNEVGVPKSLRSASIDIEVAPTGGGSTYNIDSIVGYYNCWEASSDVVELDGWETLTLDWAVTAGTTAPTDSTCGALIWQFYDAGWEDDSNNDLKFGWYKDDNNENVNQVGFHEEVDLVMNQTYGVGITFE